MADLKQTIRDNALQGTPQQVTDSLNAKTITRTSHERITASDLFARFGAVIVVGWSTALKAAGFDVAVQAMSGAGFDFAAERTIETIQLLQSQGVLDAQSAAALLALGTWQISPWEAAGGIEPVTAEQVSAAQTEIAIEDVRDSLTQDLSHRVAVVQVGINSGTIATQAQMIAAFGA